MQKYSVNIREPVKSLPERPADGGKALPDRIVRSTLKELRSIADHPATKRNWQPSAPHAQVTNNRTDTVTYISAELDIRFTDTVDES
jgi:hypothetical protein